MPDSKSSIAHIVLFGGGCFCKELLEKTTFAKLSDLLLEKTTFAKLSDLCNS